MKICPRCENQFGDETDVCPHDGMKLRRRLAPTLDPMLGRTLDERWQIEEKLGEGGMGAVYRARQLSVGRPVALKTLKQELAASDEFANRFLREVHVATTLNHPHIVTVFDYGQADDGTLFLVMELLDGKSLTDLLAEGPLPHTSVIQIGIQVASALEAAHGLKFVHRDLKPDNVFMLNMPGGALFAKVLDFGIAKVLEGDNKATQTGMIFGTPDYMSPEQCKGAGVDHRTDFYALGCMLFEMVAGHTPFKADTPMSKLLAHVNEPAPRPSSLGVPVDRRLEDFIMTLLSKDASERPSTATEVRQKLEALLPVVQNPGALHTVAGPSPFQAAGAVAATAATAAVLPSALAATAASTPTQTSTILEPANNRKLIALLVGLMVLIGGVAYGLHRVVTNTDTPPVAASAVEPVETRREAPLSEPAAQPPEADPPASAAEDQEDEPEKKKKNGKKNNSKKKDKKDREERSEAERPDEPEQTENTVVIVSSPPVQPDSKPIDDRISDFKSLGKDLQKAGEEEKKRLKRKFEDRFKR